MYGKKIYIYIPIYVFSWAVETHRHPYVRGMLLSIVFANRQWICEIWAWPNFHFKHITLAQTMLCIFHFRFSCCFFFARAAFATNILVVQGLSPSPSPSPLPSPQSMLLRLRLSPSPPLLLCLRLHRLSYHWPTFCHWHLLSTFNSCDCDKAFRCVKRANIIWFLGVPHTLIVYLVWLYDARAQHSTSQHITAHHITFFVHIASHRNVLYECWACFQSSK